MASSPGLYSEIQHLVITAVQSLSPEVESQVPGCC